MSSRTERRSDLIESVQKAFERYGNAHGLLAQAVAERLGLNVSDLIALTVIDDQGPLTPTQIAEATGLTSGAVTGVVDRLERGRFVEREADREDRRRVMVRVRGERLPEVEKLYRPVVEAGREKLALLPDEQIEFLARLMNGSADLVQRHASALRQVRAAAAEGEGPVLSAPLAGRKSARLVCKGGAAHLTISGGASPGLLYEAEFEGRAPSLRLDGDTLAFEYARFRGFDWRAHRGRLELAAGPSWDVQLRAGAARVELELQDLTLGSLELSGGVSEVNVSLPRPDGPRRMRVTGGANKLSVVRPAGVPVRLRLSGGAARIALDASRLGAAAGETLLESDGFAAGTPGWDIEVSGGASALTIGS